MNLVFIRHGQSLWNLENKFTGWVDIDLSERGEVEAKAAGVTLIDNNFYPEICFTSYLKRSINTAAYITENYKNMNITFEIKKKWDINLSNYLRYRQSLKGLILMMDCRHPLTRYDQQMLDWSSQTDINIHILLTKADKERNNALNATLNHVNQFIMKTQKPLKTVTAQLFSSKTKLGLTQLEEQINFWFQESSQF